MKKLKLLLIPLFFSSLLIGCGMKGPLYRAPETQTIEKKSITPEIKVEEQGIEQEKSSS
tara:strand:- start:13847 stop:14023 length:177 start_codon:yes stop_codon:yes gene_type:complete